MRVTRFSAARDPQALHSCQRLRYEIYHEELGLNPPDMDHERRLDVQKNDPFCELFTVEADGELVGCIRLQPPGVAPLYAEDEFVFHEAHWERERLVEGARYAVRTAHRNGSASLALFSAFRRHCRQRSYDQLVSVVIISDPLRRPENALGVLRWLAPRVRLEMHRAQPRDDYRFFGALEPETIDRAEPMPSLVPPMLRMLAGPRTVLCSAPAYCRKFLTWNFLLMTDLSVRRRR